MSPGTLRARGGRRRGRRRLLERVVARAPRSPVAEVVARGARRHRHPRVPAAARLRPRPSRSRRSPPRSPRRPASTRRRWSPSGAATRWRRRSAPACSSPARSATWSERPNPCARHRASHARTRRCSSSVTRTRTPTPGCSRTPASSPAVTFGGGATSSRPSSAARRPRVWATPTISCRRRPNACRPAPRDSVFLPCMQGAMAPEWNGAARGVFYGLTLAHTRAHMTRAILEGSAFALRDILEAMRTRASTFAGSRSSAAAPRVRCGVRSRPTSPGCRSGCRRASRRPRPARRSSPRSVLGCTPRSVTRSRRSSSTNRTSTSPIPERREAYDESYRRYRDLYAALRPVFGR